MTRPGPTLNIAFGTLVATAPAGMLHATPFDLPALPLAGVAPQAIGAALFYGACLAVLGVLLAIAVSLRHRAWALYTLLVALGLIYIALFEQNLTGIVWTGLDPGAETVLALGHAMLSVNFLVAADSLPTGHRHARLKTPLRLAAVAVWGLWGLGRAVSIDLGYTLFSACGCLVAVAHFIPVSTFLKLRGGYDRLVRDLIWVLLTLVLFGATLIVTDVFGDRGLTVAINRGLIGAITLVFALLFIRNIFILQTDRELAVRQALDHANAEVRIGRDLLEARERHADALEVSRLRNLRLASAAHDIRQPITSLRALAATLMRGQPADLRQQMQTSLDYLDALATSHLDEGQRSAQALPADPGERVATALIGETLRRMFQDDATRRGLGLEVTVDPAEVRVPALPLMRALSNLVSNAIEHASGGTVRLTGVAEGAGYAFRISNDGAGPLAFEAFAKGAGSGGTGLGLAIVRQQAASAGLIVSVAQAGGQATCVTVLIPDCAAGSGG